MECVQPKERFNRDLPGHQLLPLGFFGRKLDRGELGVDCDEVYKNIFVGDRWVLDFLTRVPLQLANANCWLTITKIVFRNWLWSIIIDKFRFLYPNHPINWPSLLITSGAAKNKQFLKILGITHVVNTADGTKFTQVQTGAHYYSDVNIKYMGLNVLDMPQAKISIHFMEAADFIDKALQNHGKVLVRSFGFLSFWLCNQLDFIINLTNTHLSSSGSLHDGL